MSFYTFEEIVSSVSADQIGAKAQSLAEMTAMGARVPEGFVIGQDELKRFVSFNDLAGIVSDVTAITDFGGSSAQLAVDVFQKAVQGGVFDPEFLSELNDKLQHLPYSHYAVRSSANCEDLKDASFAGLYETQLNISGVSYLCEAIKQCWSSLFSERVIRYSLNKGIELPRMCMSVIVQRMIPAEKSGVLFSVNPLTGNDKEMFVEACFGLGEALVSGAVTPDQYVYHWYDEFEASRVVNSKAIALLAIDASPFVTEVALSGDDATNAVLESCLLRDLVDAALTIQTYYGHPVDIEWAYYSEQFYIVQSRPITHINYSAIDGEWTTADFKDGGVSSSVCSPFMWSLYDFVWESELPKYLSEVHLIGDKPVSLWGEMFYGRPYWNVGAVKDGLKKLPGFNERSFDEDLGIAVAYEGDGHVTKTSLRSIVAGIRVLHGLKQRFKSSESNWQTFRRSQKARLLELKALDVDQLSRPKYFAFYAQFINQEYFQSEAGYFNQIYDNSNLVTLFKESFNKLNSPVEFIDLIAGLEEVSHLGLNFQIWSLSREIRGDAAALQYWSKASAVEIIELLAAGCQQYCLPSLQRLINENYFHSTRELDITVARYGEDPRFIVESVQANLALDDSVDPVKIAQGQRSKFKTNCALFEKSIPFYKRSAMMESLRRLRQFLWWREEFRDLSTHFYYYVRIYTLKLAPIFKQWGIIDDPKEIFFLTKDQVIDVLQSRLDRYEAASIVRKNVSYYQSFRHFNNPNEMGGQYPLQSGISPLSKARIVGIPCSSGVVTGRVKIIKDISDAGRLEQGDILITPFTDPGWTPTFSLISAVATETGGVLSHAAVISREYGIPAVLAIPGITETLRDGQWITINGGTGVIDLVDETEEAIL